MSQNVHFTPSYSFWYLFNNILGKYIIKQIKRANIKRVNDLKLRR